MITVGIYLAAGNSTRMGTDKRALPFADSFLGSIALQAALFSFLSTVFLIVPPNDPLDWVAFPLLQHEKIAIIHCPSTTQSSSLQCGVRKAIYQKADAAVILLADQPFVRKETINELIAHFTQTHTDYVAFANNSIPFPPVLFSASVFPSLLNIQGDEGARQLIRQKHWNGTLLHADDNRLFFDIDTMEEYKQALKYWEKGGLR
ncbi:NTP transferase domain-containing protein [Anoxybacteroides amylolyticum]|uniref:MobA-like NTP transferase domain protein n=1 Tax=Anoxybacteroides amylolyticum TaxID=294699 RepID=A0A160F2P5_9BACL|nr:NTP transferase domain-containing protein [Anoxybacillus amylolyticus]ANB59915.1 mobA-like NTP transferase domain protein [Anoxybacillus amylolyticus]